MTMNSKLLAVGAGWSVQDLICTAGPQDTPFEEQHGTVAIAPVMSGTFVYRSAQGSALLAPGAFLLGNHGRCFECGHEHGTGDRCLSFHFTPDYWEDVVASVPGVRKAVFDVPSLPPNASLLPLATAVETACEVGKPALEEVAVELAGSVLRTAAGFDGPKSSFSARDERRISETVRRIEKSAYELEGDELSLSTLSQEAGMSRYHFVRTFRNLMGMPPYQYILRTRLNRAAVRLRTSNDSISSIALEAGFNDLSTFNRRFRKLMGVAPGIFRDDIRR
ncbi:helix-turn-helix transcriptional regulator [Roseibium litorale]|uniref:Helix-turn-helix transcriptional regulator n=1 Tax=Roseibium litorale TaxID=2803841 RepID=A0ABR9CQF6_9HYPH|nr:helix-turn-helix transcriptional regulator [Roseibium litorale]MBD8892645.1 helix-turn-helix transcriptional regulator [Roseibium litorale]